jgi:hypothetical protein
MPAEHQVNVAHPNSAFSPNHHDALRRYLTIAWVDRLAASPG